MFARLETVLINKSQSPANFHMLKQQQPRPSVRKQKSNMYFVNSTKNSLCKRECEIFFKFFEYEYEL